MDDANNANPKNIFLIKLGTPNSVLKHIETLSCSHRLRGGSLGRCLNCVLLEGMVEIEKRVRRKVSLTSKQARD